MIDLVMKRPGTFTERWDNVASGDEAVHEVFDEFADYLGDPNDSAVQMRYHGQTVHITLRRDTDQFGKLVIPGDIMAQFFKIKPRTDDAEDPESFSFLTTEINHYHTPTGTYAAITLIYSQDKKYMRPQAPERTTQTA